jgi:predicted RNase H-like HicB family nuclease
MPVKALKYRVVFEKSAANWAAYVPDLPGVITTAPTKKDTQ